MQLGTEMSELERGIEPAAVRIVIGEGDRIAEKGRAADLPAGALAFEQEKTLAGGDAQKLAHLSLRRALASHKSHRPRRAVPPASPAGRSDRAPHAGEAATGRPEHSPAAGDCRRRPRQEP